MEKDQFRLMGVEFTPEEAVKALDYMIGYAAVNKTVNATDLIERALSLVRSE